MDRFLVSLSSFFLKQWLLERRGRDSFSCYGVDVFIERRGKVVCVSEVGFSYPRLSWVIVSRFQIFAMMCWFRKTRARLCARLSDCLCRKHQLTRIGMCSQDRFVHCSSSTGCLLRCWVHTSNPVRVVTTATKHRFSISKSECRRVFISLCCLFLWSKKWLHCIFISIFC